MGFRLFEHTYSSPGTFDIVSILVTECAEEVIFTVVAEVTVGESCDREETMDDDWTEDGNIGMSSEIWTANDIFGVHSGAKTTCFQFINNKWRQRQGNVNVFIDSDFRDQECNIEDHDDEPDGCNNCKHKKATVASSVFNKYHVSGDVTSTHSVTRNGVT